MNNPDRITSKLFLEASPEIVWDALTNPKKTKQYMFNCEVQSDWVVGSVIKWKGNFQGYESAERGVIIACEKGKKLKYSSFDPNFGLENKPENHLHITYELIAQHMGTELITTIENFNGDKVRTKHIADGWDQVVLPGLEKLIQEN